MRKHVLLALALLALGPWTVQAQSELYLHWDQCTSAGGTVSKSLACDTNTGPPLAMYPSLVIPVDIPRFVGAMVVVDVIVSEAPLPPWWQTATGQCRAGAISASFDATLLDLSNCPNIWMGNQPLSVLQVLQGLHGPGTFRISMAAALPDQGELALVADNSELVVTRITVSRAKTTGSGACAGCVNIACFRFVECRLVQPTGVGDYTITNGWWNNYAYLTGTSGALAPNNVWDPCEVPTLNRTWGSIKSLYR